MLTNWGRAAAALVGAVAFAQPPSFSPPPSGVPSASFPFPSLPRISGGPSVISPSPGGSAPTGQVVPVLPQSVSVTLKVEQDGTLSVAESVFVRARERMVRRAPLRIGDRVFTVSDARVRGNGTVTADADRLTITLGEGTSTVTYRVAGAVADSGDHEQVRWPVASGWDVELNTLHASFVAPRPPVGVSCLAGAAGTDTPCQQAQTDAGAVLRVRQNTLQAGQRVDLAVDLPAGTVPANAVFDTTAGPGPFALTWLSGIVLGLLALLLAGGLVLVVRARRRDAMADAPVGPVDVLVLDGDTARFASPDGVLPHQVRTVLDRPDPAVDFAVTVLDLAVRNYLWITETPRSGTPDWTVLRRNPPDDALTDYERGVHDSLLPAGAASVVLSGLAGGRAVLAPPAPQRPANRLLLVGAAVALLGVGLTVLLALTVGNALVGLAVVVAGLAAAAGARLLPARASHAGRLAQQLRGLRDHLASVRPSAIPPQHQELVFSRSLPYVVAFELTDDWLARFAGMDTSADGTVGLHWYATAEPPGSDLRQFAAALPGLVATLTSHELSGAALP